MPQTTNRFLDEIARLMNDAAGVASGVRREFDTLFRTQADRVLRELDVVKREEFEAVKDMARMAREENEALKARIAALEAQTGHRRVRPRTVWLLKAASRGFLVARAARFLNLGVPVVITAPEHRGICVMATIRQMKATARAHAGKGAARAERRAGRVPGVIYGGASRRSTSRSIMPSSSSAFMPAVFSRPVRAGCRWDQASGDPARLPARPGEGPAHPCGFPAAWAKGRKSACASRCM